RSLIKMAAASFSRAQDWYVETATGGLHREVSRRDALRPAKNFRWFTEDEARTCGALGRIIIPSDDETPGFDEIGVLDLDPLSALDNILSGSRFRQEVYAKGLWAFDELARRQYGAAFAELKAEEQLKMLQASFDALDARKPQSSPAMKVRRKLITLGQMR